MKAEQGEILRIGRMAQPALVVSNNYFNSTDMVVVCPIEKNTDEGPLHVRLNISGIDGYAQCEQLMLVDLTSRRFSKIGTITQYDTLNIADAVMSIFDYQMV